MKMGYVHRMDSAMRRAIWREVGWPKRALPWAADQPWPDEEPSVPEGESTRRQVGDTREVSRLSRG